MNRNFIFVFILLTTFSMINALSIVKRTTTFSACPVGGIEGVSVSITPDPPVSEKPESFTVSGTLKNDITADKTILGIAYGDLAKNPLGDPFTQTFDKSFKSGDPFTITASSVPTPELPAEGYLIVVVVADPTGDPKNPLDVYGCAFATVGKTPKDFTFSGYPIAERSYPIAERSYAIAERS
uniref:Dof zinc finger protein DOF3.2 n=1 Tax=Anthurium amnicola TaxID=1678845 RepID=A0A1D1ZFP9_9ARAE